MAEIDDGQTLAASLHDTVSDWSQRHPELSTRDCWTVILAGSGVFYFETIARWAEPYPMLAHELQTILANVREGIQASLEDFADNTARPQGDPR